MRKTLYKIFIVGFVVFGALGLVACREDVDVGAGENEYISDSMEVRPDPVESTATESEPWEYREWSVEELGEIIVTASTFWEDWWNGRGVFEHAEFVDWYELPLYISDTRGFAFERLLPESGLMSMDDVREFLLRYYTESWVEMALSNAIPYVGRPFVEYDGVLYVDVTRAGFPRPDWDTAEHVLMEQGNGRAMVETTVLWGSWHMLPYRGYAYPWEVIYRFTFIDGRIDTMEAPYGIFETPSGEELEAFALANLSGTIVSAGSFWESWWSLDRNFDRGFLEPAAPHLAELGYARLSLQSFHNMEHIRNYMSMFYTERWIEQELSRDNPVFLEYGGRLYTYINRDDEMMRPLWNMAEFAFIEHDEMFAVIEAEIPMSVSGSSESIERRHTFSLVNGLIDSGVGGFWE